MVKKNNLRYFGIFIGLFIVVLSLYFVLAAALAPVFWAEGNVTSVYDEGNFTINWTNTTSYTYPIGNWTLTLWMNNQLASVTDNANTTGTNSSWGYTWPFANNTEANYSFSFSAFFINGTRGANSSNVSMYVDSTIPAVSSPVRPVVNGNYSDSIVLNVSIVDAGGAILVWFNITNSSGMTNGTYIATNHEGNYWNDTLNTSLFPDGDYNVTVYANDTVNNLNNSISSGAFTIDNTNPVATFTCSPSIIGDGATTTCTCTGTDASSGVDSSLTTAAVTITANSTFGTFTTGTSNCTITDYAGNTHNATGTYTVASDSATDGTSSSSTTALKWTRSYSISDNQFKEGYTQQLATKGRIKFKVGSTIHQVGVLELTETTAKIEVSSTPQEATLAIGDTRKFDVSEEGYYDISVTLNSILDGKADLTIMSINELITEESEVGEQEKEEDAEGGEEIQESSSIFKKWWFWLIVVLVIVGIGYYVKENNSK